MEDTIEIPFFQHARDWTIDGFSVNTFLQNLGIAADPEKYVTMLDEKLSLSTIVLESEIEISETMHNEIIRGENKLMVKGLGNCAEWTKVILEYGNSIIEHYIKQTANFRDAELPGYLEKLDTVYRTIEKLTEIRNAVFLQNRFFFAANTSFYVNTSHTEQNRKRLPLMFDMLLFTETGLTELRENFQIRFEIYDALLMKTKQFLHVLQSDQYKYSNFKLDPKKGKYLILEFAAALTAKGSYLKLSENKTERNKQMNQLHRALFDLFGLEHVNFPKVEHEIYKKQENKAQHLMQLIKNLSPLSYEHFKSEKKF